MEVTILANDVVAICYTSTNVPIQRNNCKKPSLQRTVLGFVRDWIAIQKEKNEERILWRNSWWTEKIWFKILHNFCSSKTASFYFDHSKIISLILCSDFLFILSYSTSETSLNNLLYEELGLGVGIFNLFSIWKLFLCARGYSIVLDGI